MNKPLATSTELVLAKLASQGIPACARTTTRSLYNWNRPPYSDIIAFGLVLVEAKIAKVPQRGVPLWTWGNTNRVEQDDVIILVDQIDGRDNWYVFSNDSQIFYHGGVGKGTRRSLEGTRKRGVTLSEKHVAEFEAAKDAWHLIYSLLSRKLDKVFDTPTTIIVSKASGTVKG